MRPILVDMPPTEVSVAFASGGILVWSERHSRHSCRGCKQRHSFFNEGGQWKLIRTDAPSDNSDGAFPSFNVSDAPSQYSELRQSTINVSTIARIVLGESHLASSAFRAVQTGHDMSVIPHRLS